MHKLRADNKNLRKRVDSLKAELLAQQEASALLQKRMMAELTMLSRRVSDESERNDSRQEEIIYRLDMLLGKSDKILAKKVVVSGAPQPQVSMDSVEREAERLVEAEAMFNTARSDYHRGEYKLAYTGFKQVYEQMKDGELGENSLYWMGPCLMDVNQVEKAKKVFEALAQSFPEGQKLCTTMFKLSAIYATEGNVDMQKQYLQKILSSKTCATSAEFEQAAEILQELLEGNTVEPQPVSDSTAAPATETAPVAPAAEAPVAPAAEAKPAEIKPAEKAEAPAAEKAEKPAKEAAPAEKKPAKKKKIPSVKKD
jgi:TolA-binding protein